LVQNRESLGVEDHALPFPGLQQQVYGSRVELLPPIREAPTSPSVQAGSQCQQQRALGQTVQSVTIEDRLIQQLSPARSIFSLEPAQSRHLGVPAIDEKPDLLVAERRQHRLGEARQPPVLVAIGVGTAGEQHPALAEALNEAFDGLLDLVPPGLRLRHPVQTSSNSRPPLARRLLRRKGNQSPRPASSRSFLRKSQRCWAVVRSPGFGRPRAAKSRRTIRTGRRGP